MRPDQKIARGARKRLSGGESWLGWLEGTEPILRTAFAVPGDDASWDGKKMMPASVHLAHPVRYPPGAPGPRPLLSVSYRILREGTDVDGAQGAMGEEPRNVKDLK